MSQPNPNAPQLIFDYITKQSEGDQKMLNKLRAIILSTDDRIVEDWKWGAPNFGFKGMICWAVAFKKFVSMNFYKGALIDDKYCLFEEDKADEKGNRIIKFNTLEDIDETKLKYYLKQAVLLNEKDIKVPKKEIIIEIPEDFQKALDAGSKAKANFNGFPPSQQRECLEWFAEAKREATRENRILKALALLNEGKHLHWKYEK